MKLYKQEGRFEMYQVLLPGFVCARLMSKYLPVTYGELWCFCTNEKGTILLDESRMNKISAAFYKKAPAGLPTEWQTLWTDFERDIFKKSKTISLLAIENVSLKELETHYRALYTAGLEMWAISIFIDALDTGFDQQKIFEIAQEHSLLGEEVDILLAPEEQAYITVWEEALVGYGRGEVSFEALREKFFWMGTDYRDFLELTPEFVRGQLPHVHSAPKDEKIIRKNAILASHGLEANPLQTFQELAVWRDVRKRLHFTVLYGCARILREVLKRQGTDPELFKFLMPDEALALFKGKNLSGELLSRTNISRFITITSKGKIVLTVGEKAVSEFSRLSAFLPGTHGAEVRGMVASRGKVTGRVRLVPTMESEAARLMEKGDILVTSMTRPEFLPIMKKAGAIVTDEGGISCHAAIVSRELGKPCIIGTKIATQVLKDGDMVEVDAEKGVVRKI